MTAVGMVIGGRFRVDQLVGAGGMGVVVSATHLELGHRVAIKFLRDEMAQVPTVVERFMREARAVVHLRTEHVCRVIDVGRTDEGAPYIVMELLDGSDLARVVAKQPLPVTIAVEYVMQACVALAEAHAAGIVHRDLKPANLLVTRRADGGPLIKVLDFGIAKAVTDADVQLTRTHSVLGSPAYISPEQLQSARDVDVRTDIWALGATLYQLLSARLPFYRANATEMAVRIVMEPPDPLDVDPALRAVVFRCLEKAPAQRYPDVVALVAELAPFGGPSARALVAAVSTIARGAAAPPVELPVVSAHARTAAASVASLAPVPAPAGPWSGGGSSAAPWVAGAGNAASAAPWGASAAHPVLRGDADAAIARSRRRPWGWIVAALTGFAVAGAGVIYARHDPTPVPAPGSAVAVAEVRPPIDAAVAELAPDAAPPDARPVPKVQRPKDPRATDARATASRPKEPKRAPPPPPRTADAGGHAATPKPPTITGAVADTAREIKATCFESAGDTPWNTAMCWCTKKDQARAQAAFAKLAGFKRMTVRRYCAVRGINL